MITIDSDGRFQQVKLKQDPIRIIQSDYKKSKRDRKEKVTQSMQFECIRDQSMKMQNYEKNPM